MAAEQKYPYTPVPGKMEELLKKIPGIGRPPKASGAWLKSLGYTSSNDRQTLAAMRQLDIISSSGEPTEFYDALRNRDRAKVAEHIQAAYRELFEMYPDADRKDAEALQSFFRSKTTTGETTQRLMVRTFQMLCEFGDFEGAEPAPTVPKRTSRTEPTRTSRGERSANGGLTLNVNIQLQLPPSAEGEVYEKLFEAMGKHLKGLANLE
jgi:hypothetical protein